MDNTTTYFFLTPSGECRCRRVFAGDPEAMAFSVRQNLESANWPQKHNRISRMVSITTNLPKYTGPVLQRSVDTG